MALYRLILVTLLSYLGSHTILFSQIPQAFSFQSLILDDQGEPVINQQVGVKIEIHTLQMNGPIVYVEVHETTTNLAGVYSINIGEGTPELGAFASINWLNEPKFISLYHDNSGGDNYEFVGSNQLLSVPYALAAGSAYIEPLIYVSDNLIAIDNTLDLSDNNPDLNIAYLYRWIQGTPQDVYIDYSGLPSNTHIESYYDPNLPPFIINATDTIYGGQIPKIARLVITNSSQPIPLGLYDIDLEFRTVSKALETITYTIEIINSGSTEECYEDYLGMNILTTSDCEEFENLEDNQSELVFLSENELSLTNFLGSGEDALIHIFEDDNCLSSVEYLGAMVNDSTELIEAVLQFNNGLMEFDLDLLIEPSNESDPPINKFCKVTYE